MGTPFITRHVTALLIVTTAVSIRGQMSSPQIAQPSGPAVIHETDTYRIKSRRVGAEFEIRVASPLPPFIGGTPSNYDVLYVLDGDFFFGMATDMTRLMYRLFGELPPILVVGIGYGTIDGAVINDRRNRDFTPTADARAPLSGGASHFLNFLRDELKPLIAERYPQATGSSTLFGSSMGGLVASFAALERPDTFERYIIASPALWWDDHLLVRTASQRPLSRGETSARVFMAVGALEEGAGIPQTDGFRLVSNARDLAQRLQMRSAPGLEVWLHVFSDETHTSVVPAALTRGLRTLYRNVPSLTRDGQ
ncbi:MAG TPA: alpha/beta hydrolase-fold protein [Vicinamibacterales bacterium]|nr:alpha/beta hydrolase-fold protein [Vicinamibacterales bacterium]